MKKRWRAWLRAIHRDFGYVAVGFTVIYALSGLAINHIKDWDPSFTSTEITKPITPIADDESDDAAVARVTATIGTGKPDDVYRAGDELRLGYSTGAQVTVVGDHVTFQDRSPRFFLRIANWLHYNRGKAAWTYVADIYAVMLLYLALSGIFMIKGRLGLRWRGATLISLGVAAPIVYVVLSGGPSAHSGDAKADTAAKSAESPPERPPARTPTGSATPDDAQPLKTRDDIPGLGSAGSAAGDSSAQRPPARKAPDDAKLPATDDVTSLKNPWKDSPSTPTPPTRDDTRLMRPGSEREPTTDKAPIERTVGPHSTPELKNPYAGSTGTSKSSNDASKPTGELQKNPYDKSP